MIVNGNALHLPFATGSVQCVVTSPPYFGLRDYGVSGQIGLEQTPAEYVAQLVSVFAECWRVLKDDGVLWLNLGDSYANPGNKRNGEGENRALFSDKFRGGKAHLVEQRRTTGNMDGYKPKDLLGIPWRVAFALQDFGWYLRSDVIWHKPNPMPESVTDRPTKAHEYVFLLTKNARYFYDAEAVKEPISESTVKIHSSKNVNSRVGNWKIYGGEKHNSGLINGTERDLSGRNARSVWTIATQPYSGAHFATMPPALAERCILAGTSAAGECQYCGQAWKREIERITSTPGQNPGYTAATGVRNDGERAGNFTDMRAVTIGWHPTCDCPPHEPIPQTVLDPFSGAGTTQLVALRHRRRFVGTELNADYIRLARERCYEIQPRIF